MVAFALVTFTCRLFARAIMVIFTSPSSAGCSWRFTRVTGGLNSLIFSTIWAAKVRTLFCCISRLMILSCIFSAVIMSLKLLSLRRFSIASPKLGRLSLLGSLCISARVLAPLGAVVSIAEAAFLLMLFR